jgi:hypothetical protein
MVAVDGVAAAGVVAVAAGIGGVVMVEDVVVDALEVDPGPSPRPAV